MTTPDNTFGTIDMTCDVVGCVAEEQFDGFDGHVDFVTASRDARAIGWVIFTKNGTWHHLCPRHANVDRNKF